MCEKKGPEKKRGWKEDARDAFKVRQVGQTNGNVNVRMTVPVALSVSVTLAGPETGHLPEIRIDGFSTQLVRGIMIV